MGTVTHSNLSCIDSDCYYMITHMLTVHASSRHSNRGTIIFTDTLVCTNNVVVICKSISQGMNKHIQNYSKPQQITYHDMDNWAGGILCMFASHILLLQKTARDNQVICYGYHMITIQFDSSLIIFATLYTITISLLWCMDKAKYMDYTGLSELCF